MLNKIKVILSKIKDWLFLSATLIILVLFIILLNKCGNTLNKTKLNKDQDTTIIIKHKRDTIWTKDTIYLFKNIQVPNYQIDTVIKPIYVDTNNCRRVYIYRDSLVDSNLVIYYKDHIQGILRAKELSYKLKVPIKIYDSTIVKETIKLRPKFVLDGTLVLSKGIIAPGIEVGLKRFKIGLGYNLQNNQAVIGLKIPILTKY